MRRKSLSCACFTLISASKASAAHAANVTKDLIREGFHEIEPVRRETYSLFIVGATKSARENGSVKIEHYELNQEGHHTWKWVSAHYSRAKQCRERLCTRESVRGNNPGTSAGTGDV